MYPRSIHPDKSQRSPASLILIFSILVTLIWPCPARAATFVVNSGWDIKDLEAGNGLCVAYIMVIIPAVLAYCTLRGAVEEANALPGEDTIVLGSGTYTLSLEGRGEDAAATGDLDITDSVQIIGTGADTTIINANGLDRIFDIHGSDTQVLLSNLTITNGNLDDAGGGIRNEGNLMLNRVILRNNTAGQLGGALYNNGSCRLVNSALHANQALFGGGVYNSSGSSLTMTAGTLAQNRAIRGGALFNNGALSLTNVTIAGNRADLLGGGLYNTGLASLLHCTIAENSGSGLYNSTGLTMTNSLVSDNRPDNCQLNAPLNSQGGNLDSGWSCQFGALDRSGRNPRLQALTDNGGPTQTMALPPDSPAVDIGIFRDDMVSDQRGEKRPARHGLDSGAYELQSFALPASIYPLLCR